MTSDGVTRELESKTVPYSKLIIDNGMKPTRRFKLPLIDTSPYKKDRVDLVPQRICSLVNVQNNCYNTLSPPKEESFFKLVIYLDFHYKRKKKKEF